MTEHCMEEINRLNDALKQKSEEIERKARELEESYRDIKAISLFGQRITNLPDVEQVLCAIYECVAALMEADIFAAGLYDEPMSVIDYRILIENGRPVPLFQISADDGGSIASAVVKNGQEMIAGGEGTPFTENAVMHTGRSGFRLP